MGVTLKAPGYESLAHVLQRAFQQASEGKGKERHAQDLPFDQQPMQQLIGLYGVGFALGQAGKKAQESQRLPHDAAVRELLGAINYLAGAVIAMERKPANDGWVPWGGGTCPVKLGQFVEVEMEGGERQLGQAMIYDWGRNDCCIPIVAYRIPPNHANDNAPCCNGGEQSAERCRGCVEATCHG